MVKSLITTALLAALPLALAAQEAELAGHGHVSQAGAYRPGEVIVKFKADGPVKVRRKANGQLSTTSVSNVDAVLRAFGMQEAEPLMPLTGHKVSPRKMRSYAGSLVSDTDLSQLYHFRSANTSVDVHALVEQLSALDEVEYAEPNYLVYTLDAVESPDDPMMSEQPYLDAVNIKPLWGETPTMDHRPVIAIIDTGVDITHPDLAANIWTNPLEADGEEKADDDGNGFKDDVHGWDFVNQTGRIGDWNGHGTHCAGLAAAVGNNALGIVGANPDALIMPVTVMQSDGVGDIATIVKGIDYASANGADVISMSIGSYSYSIAEEEALGKAYAHTVLVAAAGNNCLGIGPKGCPYCHMSAPCFPAAFTFVLGVQAADAFGLFSNNDLVDGPVLSAYDEEKLYNYELKAPGIALMSTYPGGRYKSMSGTSMACPLVAGGVSRFIQTKEDVRHELLFGDLIHTSGTYVNFKAAFDLTDADRKPRVNLVTFRLDDSEGDNDGRPDAGELIKIYPTVRNEWGQAENIRFTLTMGENEDASLVEFLVPEVRMSYTLSSYGKAETDEPLVIRLSKEIADGRHLRLSLSAECDNASSVQDSQEFTLNIENGVELKGTQREHITLEPGVSYIVSQNWGIPRDVIVTVKAGSTIKIKDGAGISNYGFMIFEGTADNMITITKGDNDYGNIGGFLNDNANYVTFNYVIFENIKSGLTLSGHDYNNCIVRNCTFGGCLTVGANFRGCNIYNNQVSGILSSGSSFIETNIHNNLMNNPYGSAGFGSASRFYKSNYIDNEIVTHNISSPGPLDLDRSNCYGNRYSAYPNKNFSFVFNTTEPEITYLAEAYLGTANPEIAKETILDTEDGVGWGTVDVWQMLEYAAEEAPGCVDYVKVDGLNPLDDRDEFEPIGVGTHTVEIGFNRAMNQKVHPNVSMGVRPPYTTKSIAQNGLWFDPYTYKVDFTIDGKSATDGLNRIRIYGYQQKENDWQLPEERFRYNIMVQAAGSMSTGAEAIPGLGKVTLTWETKDEEFADLMGFNVYRYTLDGEGLSSDTIVVNKGIIEPGEIDEYDVMTQEYVDYDVVPGTTYHYYIKEVGTDFTQNAISNVVAATPLTAQKGDSNGSLTVDVADIMTDINYIMGDNPQPFIFEAADVNEDRTVNIIDVIGTVDLIMGTGADSNARVESTATYTVEDGILYVDSPVELGGVQVVLDSYNLRALEALNGLEQLSAPLAEGGAIFLSFSMTGETIAAGRQALLEVGDAEISDLILSDAHGRNVIAINDYVTSIPEVAVLPESEEAGVTVRIYDVTGREVPRSAMTTGIYVVSLYKDGHMLKSYKCMNR